MVKKNTKIIVKNVVLAAVALVLVLVFAVYEMKKEGIIGTKESNEIVSGFYEAYNAKERKIVYYSSSSCGYCQMQKPILETIAEDYSLEYYEIDSSLLTNSQIQKITEALDISHATPTTAIVEDGKVIKTQIGFLEGNDLVEFFKENDILEDDAIYSKEKNITFIDYSKYHDLINSSKKRVIVLGKSACSNCLATKPALNSVVEDYNIQINYLNVSKLEQVENESLFDSLEELGYDDEVFVEEGSLSTPTVLVVKNGKILKHFSGPMTTSQLVREFIKAGLIEE